MNVSYMGCRRKGRAAKKTWGGLGLVIFGVVFGGVMKFGNGAVAQHHG